MGSKRRDEILLHQISLPARRDYQLRSCSPLKADIPSKISSSQLVARAFQNARALSFNASHDEVPYVLDHAPNQRVFYSGPLTSQATAMADYPVRAGATAHAEGHARERSESDVSFATADSRGHSDDLSEVSQEQEVHHPAGKDTIDRPVAHIDEQYASSWSAHSQNKSERAENVPGVPTDILTPRRAVSGDLRASKSSLDNRARSSELTRASRSSLDNRAHRSELTRASRSSLDNRAHSSELTRASRSSLDNRARSSELTRASRSSVGNRSARSSEVMRASRSSVENRDRSSDHMFFSQYSMPLLKNPQSADEVNDGAYGPKLGEQGRGESRRRPSASIAWDSLNKSQENSPQHELAAIPFKWEEAPGKPISIAAAAERAMAKRFLKEAGESRSSVRGPQQRTVRKVNTESTLSNEEAETGRAMLSSPNSSFRSSHRFYARTAPGDRSFGPRKSFDGAHIISEVETEAHIDLVAPAAAKFLVESWVSPGNVTPEPNLTTTIPFQWEEAPGKPKVDEEAIESSKPIQLQLPPRLVAPPPPPMSADSMSKEEMRGMRQRTRSMSGPLAGYYPNTSPARRRQQQHSPPVLRRSCSPSKRSISPSRIQALAKHFSRKPSTPTSHVEYSRESYQISSAQSNNYRHSYTYGHHNSGPLEEFDRDRGRSSSNRAIGRSSSGAMLSEMANCEQDAEPHSAQMRAARSFASGPLDYGGKPKRYSSPSKRSVSPSRRIHALAKQLTSKIRPSNDQSSTTLEDPNWPVSMKQVHRQQSFTRRQQTSVCRENFNAGVASDEVSLEGTTSSSPHAWVEKQEPWSPTSILQGPNDQIEAHLSGPSSGSSDMYTQTQATTPVSDVALSKSLSRVSYESFEHSFAERASPSTAEDAGAYSPVGSPYLGPTSEDYRERKTTVGAAEGVKAIIKMCRSGSTWRKSKTQCPEMWAPTLASYFQCLEATLSNPVNAHAAITHTKQQEGDNDGQGSAPSVADSNEAQTRLPYTMPASHVEQNLAWKEYCDSPNAEFKSCLGVKLSPARFITRGNSYSMDNVMAWSERHLSHSIPTNNVEDGYRSPAYAATLELLSPSAELFRKKKRVMGTSRVKLVMPSPSTRRKTQFVEAMCKSLKRALNKCAKRCRRKTLRSSEEPVLPPTEFSFYKPN